MIIAENRNALARGFFLLARAVKEGKQELEQGWKDYEEGKLEFEEEIAKAEQELLDAKVQLDDALEIIVAMRNNEVIILDRNSNIGYNSLDSASDIVQGVSRVFPAFFLLVAALVCITTMTRMIDEERTQIGTLKALGYSNGAIISKYLIYAGSGAVLGCGLGVLVGSAAFPVILWQAYKIMLYITDGIVLKINWWLCGIVVGAYTAVMLMVTWYCCRKALKEDLKYVEAYARAGYIGHVAGVALYVKADAEEGTICGGTKKAVTYFNKKGVEVEQERDANVRLNEIYSRKYYLVALTDENECFKIVKG